MTPRSFLAVSQNGQDLRGRDQCEPPLQTLAQTLTPTNPAQLLAKISCRHLNADSNKKQRKMTYFRRKKSGLKTTFGDFLGTYELDFSYLSIFHQLWAHIGYF